MKAIKTMNTCTIEGLKDKKRKRCILQKKKKKEKLGVNFD